MRFIFHLPNLQICAESELDYRLYVEIFTKISNEIENIKQKYLNPSILLGLNKAQLSVNSYFDIKIIICGNIFSSREYFNRYDISIFIFMLNKFINEHSANIFLFPRYSNNMCEIALNLCNDTTKSMVHFKPITDMHIIHEELFHISEFLRNFNKKQIILIMPNICEYNDEHCDHNSIILTDTNQSFVKVTNDNLQKSLVYYVDESNVKNYLYYNTKSMPVYLRFTFNNNKSAHDDNIITNLTSNKYYYGTVKYIYAFFFECTKEFIDNSLILFNDVSERVEYVNNDNIVKYFNKEKQEINKRIGIAQSNDSIFSDILTIGEIIKKLELLVMKYLDDNNSDISDILRKNIIEKNKQLLHNLQIDIPDYARFNLNSITLSKFMCFHDEETINFRDNNGGLIIIKGNNGVGKSAIIDAIIMAIYMNNVSRDNLSYYINSESQLFHIRCELEITNNNCIFIIGRKRGSIVEDSIIFKSTITNEISAVDLTNMVFNELNNVRKNINLTISGSVNVAKTINGLCGNHEIALYSCLCLQRDEYDFYKLTQQNQRKILEKIFGIDFLNNIKIEVKSYMRELGELQESPKLTYDEIIAKINKLQDSLNGIDVQIQAFINYLNDLEDKLIDAKSTINSQSILDELLMKYNITELEIKSMRDNIKSGKYINDLRKLHDKYNNITVDEQLIMSYLNISSLDKLRTPKYIARMICEYDKPFGNIAKINEEIQKYKSLLLSVKKDTDEYRIYRESLANMREEINMIKKYRQWSEVKAEIMKYHDKCKLEYVKFQITNFENAKREGYINILYDEISYMEKLYNGINDAHDQIISLNEEINITKMDIRKVELAKQRILDMLGEYNEKLNDVKKYEETVYAETLENETLRILNNCYTDKDNIKLRILAYKLLTFNQIINSILLELRADLEVNITLSECKFKSGGYIKSIQLASGHQYNMINLATRIAIWKIYNGVLPNFFIFDETFVYSSQDNLEHIYDYLANKFKGPQFIIVISNNTYIDKYANNKFVCYNNNGKSRISTSDDLNNPNDLNDLNKDKCIDKSSPDYMAIVNMNKLPEYISSVNNIFVCDLCATTISKKSFINRHINSKQHKQMLSKKISIN